MLDITDKKNIVRLINEASDARNNSYAPYSKFHVGAALLGSDGRVFKGCNVENSSYSATNCAERTAVFSAVVSGTTLFDAIAIVGGKADKNTEYCYPCGVCRQVLWEFCNPNNFYVILAKDSSNYHIVTLSELLPHGFSLTDNN